MRGRVVSSDDCHKRAVDTQDLGAGEPEACHATGTKDGDRIAADGLFSGTRTGTVRLAYVPMGLPPAGTALK